MVVGEIRRHHVHDQEKVGRVLADLHTLSADLLGQAGLCGRDTVLDKHLCFVDVEADFEGDGDRQRALLRRLRVHVDHAVDAVDLLLDDGGDRIGDRLRAGTGIRGGNRDRRR